MFALVALMQLAYYVLERLKQAEGEYIVLCNATSTTTPGHLAPLLLLWVYYASCILLFGAEFTQIYAREAGHAIQPAAGAEAVTAESRAQQGLPPGKPTAAGAAARVEVRTVVKEPEGLNPLPTLLVVAVGGLVLGMITRKRDE